MTPGVVFIVLGEYLPSGTGIATHAACDHPHQRSPGCKGAFTAGIQSDALNDKLVGFLRAKGKVS